LCELCNFAPLTRPPSHLVTLIPTFFSCLESWPRGPPSLPTEPPTPLLRLYSAVGSLADRPTSSSQKKRKFMSLVPFKRLSSVPPTPSSFSLFQDGLAQELTYVLTRGRVLEVRHMPLRVGGGCALLSRSSMLCIPWGFWGCQLRRVRLSFRSGKDKTTATRLYSSRSGDGHLESHEIICGSSGSITVE
jgi:hypothetical protein